MATSTETDSRKGFVLPAEWEPQAAVQMTWPHEGTDWQPYLNEAVETFSRIAAEIARRETLIVVAQDADKARRQLERAMPAGVLAKRVRVCQCPTDDTWARDHGPLTLIRRAVAPPSEAPGVMLLDFRFNGWGEKFPADNDNLITRRLFGEPGNHARPFAKPFLLEDDQDMVLEGGSIESDGLGTVMTTSCCLLAPHRNQPMTRDDIEVQLKRRLCAKRVLWVDHGTIIGDDTDGHIDTMARFAPCGARDDQQSAAGGIVFQGCDNRDDPQYEGLNAMEEQLRDFRTLDSKPYRLFRLPMPEPIIYNGERLPATYANFLVINGAVLVPTYRQPDLDHMAMEMIGKAFPGREITGIDSTVLIRQHGSIHCLTMQYPQA